jgi:uncharacterized protein
MKIFLFKKWIVVLLCVILLILEGCAASTQKSQFFVLTSISKNSAEKLQPPSGKLSIGVGPFEFPSYLNRPNIINRVGANQVQLSEFHRWAEPIEENFSRVLAENLSTLLSTDQVSVFPWKGTLPIGFQVTMSVTKFHGELGGDSVLECRWAIFRNYGKEVLMMKKSSFKEVSKGQDYEALVSVMNKNLEKLSVEIAKAIKTLKS